ncbi:FixH family protein [Sporosarcina sp. FA9]|uniref:FixH family protein n=1 Tax=Sporosarcina sp. FA9 TaxID=3413030 RepID=UPI003F657E67
MKKLIFVVMFMLLVISGCDSNKMVVSLEKAPEYTGGVISEFVVKIKEADNAVTGLDVIATLEMAKMDHGVIEVVMVDTGDGSYAGDVELPMAGEWIADVKVNNKSENILTFDVKER